MASCPSRSASRRPRRARISKSSPSTTANSDVRTDGSSLISGAPASTKSPSSTSIPSTTPPSGCCTTCRFRSTSICPVATIAPEICAVMAQVPKPPTKRNKATSPSVKGRFADHWFVSCVMPHPQKHQRSRRCRAGFLRYFSEPRPSGQTPSKLHFPA